MAERKNEQVPLRAVLHLLCPELQSGGHKASTTVGGLIGVKDWLLTLWDQLDVHRLSFRHLEDSC